MPDADSTFSRNQVLTSASLGLLMIGLGLAYLIAPEWIEQVYGLTIPERGKYGMHYAVGVRDGFYGLLILTLTARRQRAALSTALGLGILLPLGDAGIVLLHERAGLLVALPHLAGVVVLAAVWWWVKPR